MKKSKWADWLVVIGFLGFLALALAVTLVRPKSGWSYYENRNLARPAELSVETVLDGTFPASVEPVLQDHAAGRNTLMKLSAWATRLALEWEMSRSCQRATLSKATCAFAFTTRERPQTFSTVMGLRLWGMAELPF